MLGALAVMYVLVIVVYIGLFAYIQTAITNLVFNKTTISGHGFESSLRTLPMMWIYISNALLIAFTLGLMIPWARIRTVRYRLENLSLLAAAALDGFIANVQAQTSATGKELADMLDLDIAL